MIDELYKESILLNYIRTKTKEILSSSDSEFKKWMKLDKFLIKNERDKDIKETMKWISNYNRVEFFPTLSKEELETLSLQVNNIWRINVNKS